MWIMWTSLVIKGFFRPCGNVEKAVKKVHKPCQRFVGVSEDAEARAGVSNGGGAWAA